MSVSTHLVDTAVATPEPAAPPGRAWALAGAVGGLTGLVGLFVTAGLTDVDTSVFADNARYVAAVAGREAYVWAFQILTTVSAACLAVFAVGLRRRLAAREISGSLLPEIAAAGPLLTAALLLVGGGVSTELYFNLLHAHETDADLVAALLSLYGTLPWVWAGIGLSAGALAVTGLARRAAGRWFGAFSLLMALAIAATQAVPLQYLALVPAGLWTTVAGLTFAVEQRAIGNRRPA
ncbi:MULTISPECIES: hypothetical protein [unclassified Micromonospora]|uniref:hypothetical protein n=1 Tax=unclassified Micromonospora TaxID=2617518 RepID=UPI00363D5FD9